MVPRIWQAHSNHVTVCRRGRVWRLCTWHAHLTITPAARSAGEEEEARLVHAAEGGLVSQAEALGEPLEGAKLRGRVGEPVDHVEHQL